MHNDDVLANKEHCFFLRLQQHPTQIYLRTWGDSTHTPVLLLHGSLAHGAWYAALGPLLATKGVFVIAPDFPGHGQSAWSECYNAALFHDFFKTLCQHVHTPPTIIAHSLAARITCDFYQRFPDCFERLVLLDPPAPWSGQRHSPPKTRTRKIIYHSCKERLIERFRIVPAQPHIADPELFRYVASTSITHDEAGYRWSFDPNFWFRFDLSGFQTHFDSKHAHRTQLIAGILSSVTTQAVVAQYQQKIPNLDVFYIQNAYHALMLDQPQALAKTILSILNNSPT